MDDVVNQARALGFTEAALLSGLALECHPELRAYCNPEQCQNWGQNWVCPPGSGPLEACQARLDAFHEGILLRSVTALTPPTPLETYQDLQRVHNQRLRQFLESIRPQVGRLLPLSTGGCLICDRCCYPAPCVHPDIKMESLSAFGIDVGALCALAGLPFAFSDTSVTYVALVLVDRA